MAPTHPLSVDSNMWMQSVDTVFVAVATPARSVAAEWAIVLLGLLAALGIAGILLLLLQVRRALRAVAARSHDFEHKVDPLLERARGIAANVEFITSTLKDDAEALHTGARAISDRLTEASEHLEDRIREFNALMEVVQEEAEGAFIHTVSTARGVREGARRFSRHTTDRAKSAADRGGSVADRGGSAGRGTSTDRGD